MKKHEKKSLIYLAAGILGILLIVLAIALNGRVPDTVSGPLIGVGAGLAGMGISMWRLILWEKKDPVRWKQNEIESKDERNVIIRFRAKAVAGEVLQWTVIAAAWAAVFLDVPLWIILAAVGLFLFKIILEICLTARYQKEM